MSENELPVIVRILLVKLCVVWVTFFYNLQIIVCCLETIFLLPANEVCESNVFTGVCLFTGEGVSVQLSRGVSVWGLCPGCLSSGGISVRGGEVSVQGDPHTVKSGRYASYWNALLFKSFFLLGNLIQPE